MKSTAELAAEQATFWNGPGGRMWLASYERIERAVAWFGEAVLAAAAASPGEKVLDIGCGTGRTSAALARAVGPEGRVLAVDISAMLIDAARAQSVPNATFVVGDAVTLPLGAAEYDLLFSRFGVMFFGDPTAAFQNLHRAAKPSGRLVFLCWRTQRENPWSLIPLRAVQPHLPPVPPAGPEDPGQYSFGERTRVERILKASGFGAPSFRPLDHPIWLGRDIADAVEGLTARGPMARRLADATPQQVEKAKAAIATALEPHRSGDGIFLPGACWLVSAPAR
jgi:SAM-dependent methyltransferase